MKYFFAIIFLPGMEQMKNRSGKKFNEAYREMRKLPDAAEQ
jgi:hypothetical protein